jgi:hypothetical protein
MNPDSSKLRQEHEQREQSTEAQLQHQTQAGREFTSVEEMIRFDTQQTLPPERISERLKESVDRDPVPTKPWWRRLFGG